MASLPVLPLQTWLSIASTAGYGVAKIPAYSYVAGMPRALRRDLVLWLLVAMFTLCVGFFAGVPDVARVCFQLWAQGPACAAPQS